MVFSSIYFLWGFLPVAIIIYLLLDKKFYNVFLLLLSIGFYAWGQTEAIAILTIVIVINYVLVYCMEKCWGACRGGVLWFIICINAGILFYYKYSKFVFHDILNINVDIESSVMPVGISFYIFSVLSYAIEVYKRNVTPTGNICDLGLFVSFFPKLVQGPIVKYTDFEKQLSNRTLTYDNLYLGITRFIVGLGKKTLIANVLGDVADEIFGLNGTELSTGVAWLGALCYTIQIYYDFSGYSDMAIGLGKLFGFGLNENFNYPYTATSLKDFWHRWHISLSSWFRDYIYISLGGNRNGKWRTCFNTLVVFAITGVWHGANWTFWIWGLWHGIIQILENLVWGKYIKKQNIVGIFYTNLVVLLGWVLFRANSIGYAIFYIKSMFIYKAAVINFSVINYLNIKVFITLIVGIAFSGAVQIRMKEYIKQKTIVFELAKIFFLCTIFFFSLVSIAGGTYNPFIYFQF